MTSASSNSSSPILLRRCSSSPAICALKHDVVPVVIEDPLESGLPAAAAVLELTDPETGRRSALDLRQAGAAMAAEESRRRKELSRVLRACGLDEAVVSTGRPTIEPLVAFFRRRARRRSR